MYASMRGSRVPISVLAAKSCQLADVQRTPRTRCTVLPGVFTRAEAAAAWFVSFFAAAMLAAYVEDALGGSLHPTAILVVSLLAATGLIATIARGERVQPRADVDLL